jgi:hypothetical protein
MRLKDVCDIKLNFPDADFWLTRKGSEKQVGKPVKTFSPENIGIKVIDTDILVPDYLYYIMTYFHGKGYFNSISHGTLSLKNIRTEDIKNIRLREE